jgi:sugar lactone lactonase YvrE
LASWVDAPGSRFSRVEIYHDSVSKVDLNFSDIANAVAIDPSGNLYVGSRSSAQIQKYSSAGLPQGAFATAPRPLTGGSVAFNAAGNLFVATTDLPSPSLTSSIEQFASNGAPLGKFATGAPGVHFDMAINRGGQVYLTTVNSSIQRFDSDGTMLNAFPTGGTPNSLAVDSQSNVYAVINNTSVVAFTSSGASLGTVISGLGLIRSIAVDASDTLYVGGGVEFQSQGFIKKYSTSGTFLGDFVSGQPGIAYDLAFAAPVPEPSALSMTAILGGCVLAYGRARFGSPDSTTSAAVRMQAWRAYRTSRISSAR